LLGGGYQACVDFGCGQAIDADDLAAAGLPVEERNASAGDDELFSQEGDQGIVGATIAGWCGEGDLERSVMDPRDGLRRAPGWTRRVSVQPVWMGSNMSVT
jgi:hypothetical protein